MGNRDLQRGRVIQLERVPPGAQDLEVRLRGVLGQVQLAHPPALQQAAQERGLRALQARACRPALPRGALRRNSCAVMWRGWARAEKRTPAARGAWGLQPPRGRTSRGGRTRAARGSVPVTTPVRSAPLRPGMAASSAVAPAVRPGPRGAPSLPGSGSGCARGTRRVGVGWCCLGRTPHPHTPVFLESVWCLVIAPRRLSPCLYVCLSAHASVGSPPSPPSSFVHRALIFIIPCRGSWQLLGEASLLTVSITGTGQRDAGGPRTTTGVRGVEVLRSVRGRRLSLPLPGDLPAQPPETQQPTLLPALT